MTALSGTNTTVSRWAAGQTFTAIGTYTLVGAIANADTITWTSLIPAGGVEVQQVNFYGVELDTDASPTATVDVGDGSDADGFIDGVSVGLAAAGANQILAKGNGSKIGTVYTSATDVVATISAAVATAASSGDVRVEVIYNCVGKV